jgi:hypothetical protein
MTIHFCQKYKPVFLTKGKSFFYRFITNPISLLWQFQVKEDGLGECVELGEGGATLGPESLRAVQGLRNPPLLGLAVEGVL